MSERSDLEAAVVAAATAHRQDSSKWNQAYEAFEDVLGVDRGVVGKLLTQEKQLSNRLQKELIRENPAYIVLCALPAVRLDKARQHLAEAVLPAARCALIFTYDDALNKLEPVELQVYQPDEVSQKLTALYPDLQPIKVDRAETAAGQGPGEVTGATGGQAKPIAVVPMVVDDRIRRALRLSVLTTSAVLLVGPPGTGKTALLRELLEEIEADHAAFGFSHAHAGALWTTPEESWGTRDLVGGETVAEDNALRFREGHVLQAIRQDHWLVLDEVNRADMDKIFGGLLTWLSNQEVRLGTASSRADAPPVTLGWTDEPTSKTENLNELEANLEQPHGDAPVRYLAGSEWRLLGTYNALDAQRVFRFGHALGRRFVRVPIPPISPDQFATAADPLLIKLPASVRTRVPDLYGAHYAEEGTQLGPALFMRIPDYVEAGLLGATGLEETTDEQPEPDGTDAGQADAIPGEEGTSPATDGEAPAEHPSYAVRLLSEAYLVNVGAFLARYEPDELERLGQRIVDSGALPEQEWNWILDMSRHLG